MATRFKETQRFTQFWLWALVILMAGGVWRTSWVQLVRGVPVGDNPAPDSVMATFWILFGVGLPLLLGVTRLRTEVRDDGVHIRFIPFHIRPRHWTFDEITDVEALTYSPLRDYGGWGIRMGPQGWGYNVSGDRGVRLTVRSGQHVLIGSREPERLAEAIRWGIQD